MGRNRPVVRVFKYPEDILGLEFWKLLAASVVCMLVLASAAEVIGLRPHAVETAGQVGGATPVIIYICSILAELFRRPPAP